MGNGTRATLQPGSLVEAAPRRVLREYYDVDEVADMWSSIGAAARRPHDRSKELFAERGQEGVAPPPDGIVSQLGTASQLPGAGPAEPKINVPASDGHSRSWGRRTICRSVAVDRAESAASVVMPG